MSAYISRRGTLRYWFHLPSVEPGEIHNRLRGEGQRGLCADDHRYRKPTGGGDGGQKLSVALDDKLYPHAP